MFCAFGWNLLLDIPAPVPRCDQDTCAVEHGFVGLPSQTTSGAREAAVLRLARLRGLQAIPNCNHVLVPFNQTLQKRARQTGFKSITSVGGTYPVIGGAIWFSMSVVPNLYCRMHHIPILALALPYSSTTVLAAGAPDWV